MTEYINTYNELCEKVKRWSAAYYEQDAPVVTDEEYDRAMHEIRDLEAAHPELVTSDSPTQVVGGKRVIGIPVEHRVPMLSLLDVFSDDEVRDFTASVVKEYPDATFSIERKIDGLSLSLVYAKPAGSDGKLRLVQASTRGDGHIGEDVTDNVKVLGIPVNIQMPDGIWKIELRGECYMSEEDFDAVLNANLKGAFLCCKEAARRMVRQRWGRIVNLSSVVALRGNAGQTNYAASKAGLIGLTKSLARELASRNVTVNAVAPGFIETDMTAALPEAVRAEMAKGIPAGRAGKPEDVANAVAFFAAEQSSYLTGQVLCADGGMAM